MNLRSFSFGLIVGFVLFPSVLLAQVAATGAGRATPVAPSTSYAMDIVATPTGFYSLRAGSAAIAAAGTQNIVDLRRTSDNATCTVPIAASGGGIDLTIKTPCNSSTQTVTAWLNNASACTGSIATTVLTVSACSAGNLTIGLPISGAGITANTIIISLGTGTGGIGTYNLNNSQTIASEAITAPHWAAIPGWYDQSGNARNITQATAGNQPLLILTCLGAFPCISYLASTITLSSTSVTPATGLVSLSAVGNRASGLGNGPTFRQNAANNRLQGRTNTPNYWTLIGGSSGSFHAPATDAAWNAANILINGASSVMRVNGSETTGTATGNTTAGTIGVIGPSAGITQVSEFGLWDNVAFTLDNRAAIELGQRNYWGF